MTGAQRARKIARIVALSLAGIWGFYLVAMNVCLRTRLLRHILDQDPDTIFVEYTSAYSLIPGHIRVDGLHIRGRDSHVEWILSIDRCDFHVSFVDLMRKRFHVDHVAGDGIALRIRQREPSFSAEEASALPPIPGFADPPLSGPPPPPLTDANYNLWSIWLDGVVADHIRELWIDTIRYTGDIEVRGRWFFRPVRWLDIGPATVEARTLDVSYGMDEAWVSNASGLLFVTMTPFDVRAVEGGSMLDQFSVAGVLRGVAHLAPPSNRALAATDVRLEPTDAKFNASFAIFHGTVCPQSELRAERFPLLAHASGLDLAASVEATLRVDDGGVARTDARLRDVRANEHGELRALAEHVDVQIESRERDLSNPFSDASYSLDFGGLGVSALRRWIERFGLAPSVSVDAEQAMASGRFAGVLAKRSAAGRALVELGRLSISAGGNRLDGDASVAFDFSYEPIRRRVDFTDAHVVLRQLSAQRGELRVLVPTATLRASRVSVESSGASGVVAIDAPSVDLPSVSRLGALFPLPAGVGVEGGHAHGDARLDVDLATMTMAGVARVAAAGVRIRLGSRAMDGALDVLLQAKRTGTVTDVSRSVVQFREGGAEGWWARVDVPTAQLKAVDGAHFRAHLVVHAKDASPIAAFLSSQGDVATKLALGAIPTSGLHATGDLVVAPSTVEVRSAAAQADGFTLDFELANIGKERTMALFVVVGLVRAGIDVTDGKTNVMLFGAEPWFAARTASLRAYERRYE